MFVQWLVQELDRTVVQVAGDRHNESCVGECMCSEPRTRVHPHKGLGFRSCLRDR